MIFNGCWCLQGGKYNDFRSFTKYFDKHLAVATSKQWNAFCKIGVYHKSYIMTTTTTTMTTIEIANRLTELCREGDFETAQRELFSDDAISIEPYASPVFEKETKGLQAIIEKGHKFEELTEKIYSLTVSDPLIATNSFVVSMQMDMSMKGKDRMDMTELCLYKVKDGKIISEEFFV
jgi:limonene-1,2-epoxide hydrolase